MQRWPIQLQIYFMEYFILKHQVDTDETGSVDRQIVWKNPKKKEPNPLFIINRAKDNLYPPDNLFPFDYLELYKGAILSDLMSSQFYNGFIISKKLKGIFEESNVNDCKFYDVKIFSNDKEIPDYYYFHSASCLRDFINYRKSTFYIGDILGKKIKELKADINTYADLVKVHSELTIGAELLYPNFFYLGAKFPFNTNLFRFCAFNYDFFIAKKLKEKIEANNITGVSINPINGFIETPALA